MQSVSLKSAICQTFALSVNTEILGGNKVSFLTPAGIVSGRPIPKDPQEQNKGTQAYRSIIRGAMGALDETHDVEFSGNPVESYILLRDVEIRLANSSSLDEPIRMDSFVIFPDSVIGVCLTPAQVEPEAAQA